MASLIKIKSFSDTRGSLAVIDRECPFEIKRVYFIYNVPPGEHRGFHRHKVTRQLLVAVTGTCKVHVDNGKKKNEIKLSSSEEVLLVEPEDWHYMYDFSQNCVLAVAASTSYDKSDYITEPYS